jgi:hypothetical protein
LITPSLPWWSQLTFDPTFIRWQLQRIDVVAVDAPRSARTMFTARRRCFNQRPSAMHATLQGVSRRHTHILLQLRLPHHSNFRERFRTKHFAWLEQRHCYIGMGAGQARSVRFQPPSSQWTTLKPPAFIPANHWPMRYSKKSRVKMLSIVRPSGFCG